VVIVGPRPFDDTGFVTKTRRGRVVSAWAFYGLMALAAVALADDAANDATWERATGVGAGAWTADAQIEGQSFSASDCGHQGCNLSFTFQKARTGTYPYGGAGGRTVRGVHVKINASASGCECQRFRTIQILRSTRINNGAVETADPIEPTRQARSGWGDAQAPSRGWRIDQLISGTDPFYDDGSGDLSGESGAGNIPGRVRDAPGDWDADRNVGKDFYTCLVCENDPAAKRRVLGCVHWGYQIDGAGAVTFSPSPPTASCDTPQELRDALGAGRWNGTSPNLDL
jgi:hypothetical protein